MYYQKALVVPAQTSQQDPVVATLLLTRGVIDRILVGFPPGCAGLCHLQIFDKGWQILPWTLGESLAWDNYVYDLPQGYPLLAEPFEVTLEAWNDDDTFDHTLFVGVVMDEKGSLVTLQSPVAIPMPGVVP